MRTGAYVLKSGDVLEREERELENEIFVKETQDYTFQWFAASLPARKSLKRFGIFFLKQIFLFHNDRFFFFF